ncbi:Hypothetical protein CINCED_3A023764 [Cinara cedri]|uniref:Uncharacterized protein n=1 Tax=Cinara cedri TaxID=506608 RepID=A0A5E4N2J2_9HEMI|nr:Hypothetical protein CINCED_3A023764 [Cinara cedri]
MGNKSSTGSSPDRREETETAAVVPVGAAAAAAAAATPAAAVAKVVDESDEDEDDDGETSAPTGRAAWVRDMNVKLANFVDSFKNYRKIRNGFTRISNNDDEKRII